MQSLIAIKYFWIQNCPTSFFTNSRHGTDTGSAMTRGSTSADKLARCQASAGPWLSLSHYFAVRYNLVFIISFVALTCFGGLRILALGTKFYYCTRTNSFTHLVMQIKKLWYSAESRVLLVGRYRYRIQTNNGMSSISKDKRTNQKGAGCRAVEISKN
jgi:hypothetical protein